MADPRKQHVIFVLIYIIILVEKSALNDAQNVNKLSKPKKILNNVLEDLDKTEQIYQRKLNVRKEDAKTKHKYTDHEQNLADKYPTVGLLNPIDSHQNKLIQKHNVISGKEDGKYNTIPKWQTKGYGSLKTKPTTQKPYAIKNRPELQHPVNEVYEKNEKKLLKALVGLTKQYEIHVETYRRKYDSLTPEQKREFENRIDRIVKSKEKYANILKENAAKMSGSLSKNTETDKSSPKTPKLTDLRPMKSGSSNNISDKNGTVLSNGTSGNSETIKHVSNKDASGVSDRNSTVSNKTSDGVSDRNGTVYNKSSNAVSDRNGTVSNKSSNAVSDRSNGTVSNKSSNAVSDTNRTISNKTSGGVSNTNKTVSNNNASGVSNTNKTVSYNNASGVSNTNKTVSNNNASGVSEAKGTFSEKYSNSVSDRNGDISDKDSISFTERKTGGDANGNLSGVSRNVVRKTIGTDNEVLPACDIPTTDIDSDFNENSKSKMRSIDLFSRYHLLLDKLKNMTTTRNQDQNFEKVVGRKNHKIVMVKFPAEFNMNTGLPQNKKGQNIVLTKNEEFDYVDKNGKNKEW